MDLLSDLNESQKRAVTHVDGPLLVLAGAGSGKTRVITRRIAHLVSRGVSPRSILAITFTNKAAGEMARRVESLGVPRGAFIGTFHSFCFRLLREFADQTRLPKEFTIYDKNDQTRCVKDAMKRLEIPSNQFAPGAIQSAISNAKNRLLTPDRYAAEARGFFQQTAARIYTLYQRILVENGAVDFDDLLLRTAFLMRDVPDMREMLGRRHRYILIDEYQDTNHTQYVIAHGIAAEHDNICVTGDPDQSIYAWRGADINNILEFESDYPNAMVVRLEENYRSTQPILTVADRLIANNSRRKSKRLISTRGAGIDVGVIRLDDEHAEA
ncbi:MAG: UvrD-helicase domain-containing protein, partial [Phycisphaerae bacterium]|nr:UvrD-helicase domain-containing protein [Phycisphaerae bacterium]